MNKCRLDDVQRMSSYCIRKRSKHLIVQYTLVGQNTNEELLVSQAQCMLHLSTPHEETFADEKGACFGLNGKGMEYCGNSSLLSGSDSLCRYCA